MTRLVFLMVLLAGCGSADNWRSLVSGEGTIERSDGPALYWRALGTGPDTVVVVHGGVGLHHSYLLEPLGVFLPGRTLIFFDLGGRGRSEAIQDSTRLTADNDMADLDAVRRHFNLSRMAVIGHHWGAAVAARYAVRHAEHVSRLLLLSPFPVHYSLFFEFATVRGDTAEFNRGLAAVGGMSSADSVAALCPAHWSLYFTPWHTDSGTPYSRMGAAMCDAPAPALARADFVRRQVQSGLGQWVWREELNALQLPVLIVEGGGVIEIDDAAKRWAQHLPDARVLLLRRPYLFPWIGDPKRFHEAGETFLNGAWPSGAEQPPRWAPK
ncbi:MAG: alpha/beta hydrolase [Gemmatimonadales bacterium]|nr:alpha/beta hydrolase [Gemmatimonadales bacterium]